MYTDTSHQHPPTKASLKAWWQQFTSSQRSNKKDTDLHTKAANYRAFNTRPLSGENTVFGKPLHESLQYANVQISTASASGELYVWGLIPVVVAKCGLYLKENATEVEGIFRVSGSSKRMRDLQAAFETPPRYGKDLDWKQEGYTIHDVASVFRRYLTQMPEPIIPHDLYHDFRDTLAKDNYNQDEVILTYKRLIRRMPRPNQWLLLYVLDILSVFARKSDKNLMTASNLAVVFRPGLISHPNHEMSPKEHTLSQRVLEFMIAHQDWFMDVVPPPPPRGEDGQVLVPGRSSSDPWSGSDSELSQVGDVNWNAKVQRRRTTYDHDPTAKLKAGVLAEPDMSPVPESPGTPTSGGHAHHLSAVTVTRSRTLPSQRRQGGGPTGPPLEGADRSRVLRKSKRASSSQPSRNGTLDSRE